MRAVLVGDERAAAEALVRGDRDHDVAERLTVYGHAYFARLHEALGQDYPALAAELGAGAFHELVKLYLRAHPSRFASLRDVGGEVAAWLERGALADAFRRRCAHAADLARFEWALVEAFDAADAPVLARDAMVRVAPEHWAGMRLALTPSLRLLSVAFPVHERLPGDDTRPRPPAPLAARRTDYRIWRHDEIVRWKEIPSFELAALRDAAAGAPFGALCERLAETGGAEGTAAMAAALLERWLAAGLVAGVEA